MAQETRKRPGAQHALQGQQNKRSRLEKVQDADHEEIPESSLDEYYTNETVDDVEGNNQTVAQTSKSLQESLAAKFQQLQRPDTWPKEFATKVDEAEARTKRDLTANLQQRDTTTKAFKHAITKIVTQAVTQQNPKAVGETSPLLVSVKAEHRPLCTKSQLLLEKSRALLEDYNDLIAHTQKTPETVDLSVRFTKERERLIRLVKLGKNVTYNQIYQLLEHSQTPSDWQHMDVFGSSEDDLVDVKAMLHAGFKKLDSTEQENVESWRHIAQDALKAFKGLRRVAEGK